MSLFDGLKDLISHFTGDAAANITDNLPVDEITNAAGDAANSVGDVSAEATSKVEDAKNSLGL